MVGSDRCEEVIKTLVELVSSTSSVATELARQRPVAGDLQSARQQQDAVQVDHVLILLLWCCPLLVGVTKNNSRNHLT